MTMIEQVARALAFASLDPETRVAVDMDKHFPFVRDFYMAQARAAIQAMREPTEEMLDRAPTWRDDAARYHRAMIDAALSETSEES